MTQVHAPVSYAAELSEQARRYLRAAEMLPAEDGDLLYPRCFLFGHATELAFKAFLLRTTGSFPTGHDLEELMKLASDAGVQLTTEQRANVIPSLNNIYFERGPNERHPVRYPLAGLQAWGTPGPAAMAALIQVLREQAKPPP